MQAAILLTADKLNTCARALLSDLQLLVAKKAAVIIRFTGMDEPWRAIGKAFRESLGDEPGTMSSVEDDNRWIDVVALHIQRVIEGPSTAKERHVETAPPVEMKEGHEAVIRIEGTNIQGMARGLPMSIRLHELIDRMGEAKDASLSEPTALPQELDGAVMAGKRKTGHEDNERIFKCRKKGEKKWKTKERQRLKQRNPEKPDGEA